VVGPRNFDRVAHIYDETRALPAEVVAHVADVLAAAVSGRGPCLEIGVGTGRIAVPLHEHGVAMVGVDLSDAMLAVLVGKGDGRAPFPVARADATRLPFADNSFGAGIASHVFHLIPTWRDAVDELLRVVRPGGVVFTSFTDRTGGSVPHRVRERFREACGLPPGNVGADQAGRQVREVLLAAGAIATEVLEVPVARTETVSGLIDELASGWWSWTWDLEPEVLAHAAAATRTWAAAEIVDLDAPVTAVEPLHWTAFDLPTVDVLPPASGDR
jgi:SAM-dependent methyltransferase